MVGCAMYDMTHANPGLWIVQHVGGPRGSLPNGARLLMGDTRHWDVSDHFSMLAFGDVLTYTSPDALAHSDGCSTFPSGPILPISFVCPDVVVPQVSLGHSRALNNVQVEVCVICLTNSMQATKQRTIPMRFLASYVQ
jgi:hypothetical protein